MGINWTKAPGNGKAEIVRWLVTVFNVIGDGRRLWVKPADQQEGCQPRPTLGSRELQGRLRLSAGVVAMAAMAALGLYAWRNGVRPEDLAALGYPGVFLVMLVSGAGTFLPGPGIAVVLAAGTLWNPILVGLAAGLGNATGELAGYAVGSAGTTALPVFLNNRWVAALKRWLARYGFFAVLALALIPNPVFDAVGLVAGSLGFPIRRFWLACTLGNSAKYVGMACLGAAAGPRLGVG
ncbi:MAG: VTT domain-containing protein [Dehalococcoidia bacterium]|nr:VTT domain-containing protein [Dehalococcoidia bacterium]